MVKKHTTVNRGLLIKKAYDSKSWTFGKKAYDSKSWTFDKKAYDSKSWTFNKKKSIRQTVNRGLLTVTNRRRQQIVDF